MYARGIMFMPDGDAANTGGAPATSAQPSPGNAPTGGHNYEAENARLRSENERYRQQVSGFQPFGEKLGKLGLKKPEDLDRWAPVFSQVKDPESFTRGFQGQNDPEDDIPALVEKRVTDALSKRDQEIARREAEAEHKRATSDFNGAKSAFIESLMPEQANEHTKYIYSLALSKAIDDAYYSPTNIYDSGPLKGQEFKPLDKSTLDRIGSDVRKKLGLADGARLAAIGAAVASSPPATQRDGNGQPPAPNGRTKTKDTDESGVPTTDFLKRKHEELKRRRASGSMSSV